jgi:hypothetical protein
MPQSKIGLYTANLHELHPLHKLPSEDKITVMTRCRETDFHVLKKEIRDILLGYSKSVKK